MVSNVDFFVSRCERERINSDELKLYARDQIHLAGLMRCLPGVIEWGLNLGYEKLLIDYPGNEYDPLEVGSWLLEHSVRCQTNLPSHRVPELPGRLNLKTAKHQEVLTFLCQQADDGLAVVIASLAEDMRVLYANDWVRSDRILCSPAELLRCDNPHLWRDSMGIYEDLVERLTSELWLPTFPYQHYRVDGSFCRYHHNFYYCENWMGVPVRIAISRPNDWEEISVVGT